MSFWEHLEELRSCVIKIAITLAAISGLTFFSSLRSTALLGLTVYYPYPDVYNNMNTQIFNYVRNDVLGGTGIDLIQFEVADAMIIQMKISLFLAITFGMPMIVYQLNKFFSPGMYAKERRMIMMMTIPATFLFILGCVFAYVLIIPFTFEFLYGYTFAMGVTQTLSMNSFFSFILLFLIAFGAVFEMPIIQYGLTKIGVVEPEFWKENWRYAFVGMILFAGVITPDGSGITQLLIAFPMLGLYYVGYIVSKYTHSKDPANSDEPSKQDNPDQS